MNANKGLSLAGARSLVIAVGLAVGASDLLACANEPIGNADGSNSISTVNSRKLVQANAAVIGSKATQNLEIGNPANGREATVSLKTVVVPNTGVVSRVFRTFVGGSSIRSQATTPTSASR